MNTDIDFEEIVEEAEYLTNEELSRFNSELFQGSEYGNIARKFSIRRETVATGHGSLDF